MAVWQTAGTSYEQQSSWTSLMAAAMVLAAADPDLDIGGDEKFCFHMYGARCDSCWIERCQ